MEEKYLAEYLRLSIEDGDVVSGSGKTESDSIRGQRMLIRRYREEKGLYPGVHTLELVDDGYSGTNFDRPAVKRLLSLVREGKICCIIVKDLSRFGRDYLEVGDYLEQIFPFMGVRFISINDGYDSNDHIGTTGGIEVAFKSLLYDLYSKDLSMKIRSALEIRKKRGDIISTRAPFGYRISADRKRLLIDEEAAQVVKKIFHLAGTGYSTGKIAAQLNKEGVPAPGLYRNKRGDGYRLTDGMGYWNHESVGKILKNQVYLGTAIDAGPDGERYGAIVTGPIFTEASKVMKVKKRKKGTDALKGKEALIGKLCCGNCKRRLIRTTNMKIPHFFCARARVQADGGCMQERLPEPEAEAIVMKKIAERLGQEEQGRGSKGKESAGDRRRADRPWEKKEAIEKKRSALKMERRYLYEKFKQGQIGRDVYLHKMGRIRDEEARLCGEIYRVEEMKSVYAKRQDTADEGCPDGVTGLTRELVEQFIDRIDVYEGKRMEIIWKIPI